MESIVADAHPATSGSWLNADFRAQCDALQRRWMLLQEELGADHDDAQIAANWFVLSLGLVDRPADSPGLLRRVEPALRRAGAAQLTGLGLNLTVQARFLADGGWGRAEPLLHEAVGLLHSSDRASDVDVLLAVDMLGRAMLNNGRALKAMQTLEQVMLTRLGRLFVDLPPAAAHHLL